MYSEIYVQSVQQDGKNGKTRLRQTFRLVNWLTVVKFLFVVNLVSNENFPEISSLIRSAVYDELAV